MARVPMRLRNRSRSVRMRASTGKAVMLMAAPMNSAKPMNDTLSSESRGYRNRAVRLPRQNGVTMLT